MHKAQFLAADMAVHKEQHLEVHRNCNREQYRAARNRVAVSKGNYTEDSFDKGDNLDDGADNRAQHHPLSQNPCLVVGDGVFDGVDVGAFDLGLRIFWLVDSSEHEKCSLKDVCLSLICHFGYYG